MNSKTPSSVRKTTHSPSLTVAQTGLQLLPDLQILMKPLQSTGLSAVGDSQVHSGFLYAYNVVSSTVLKTVKAQAASYPSYTIVVTGHSLGGAVASLAAVSIKSALPKASLKLYTYGVFLFYTCNGRDLLLIVDI